MVWFLRHSTRARTHKPTPFQPVRVEKLRTPPETLRLTWLGHSSVLIQWKETTFLTDPIFSERASPFSFAGPRRQVPLPLQPEDLPPVDIVLISHDHYDHLDRPTVEWLNTRFQPLFLVPLGVKAHLLKWGITRVVEMDWWQYVDVGPFRLHCTPAQHFSGRWLTDRDRTLWAGWLVERDSMRLYFAGDTGYGPHFQTIRQHLGTPDWVLMPIGAYRPHWLMQPVHVAPEEALQAFLDVGGQHMLPIHWGTFDLADEPLHEPPERLLQAAHKHDVPLPRIHVLPVGGSAESP